jgi:predicted DCC family thiol-disulfide oxidoreductase YuxK
MSPLTIWYNTLCPVCNAGITWQKTLLLPAVQAGQVQFLNINETPEALARFDVSVEQIRKRLHATTGADDLLVGADVVIAVMRITPGQRWLGGLIGSPVMIVFTRLVYNGFAEILYRWNRRKRHW